MPRFSLVLDQQHNFSANDADRHNQNASKVIGANSFIIFSSPIFFNYFLIIIPLTKSQCKDKEINFTTYSTTNYLRCVQYNKIKYYSLQVLFFNFILNATHYYATIKSFQIKKRENKRIQENCFNFIFCKKVLHYYYKSLV